MKTQPYPEDIDTPEAFDDLEDNSGDDITLELVATQGGRLDQVLADMIPEHWVRELSVMQVCHAASVSIPAKEP